MQSIEDIASLEPDHVDHSMRDLATRAQESWASMTPEDRTALLRKLLLSMQVRDVCTGAGSRASLGRWTAACVPDRCVWSYLAGGRPQHGRGRRRQGGHGGPTGAATRDSFPDQDVDAADPGHVAEGYGGRRGHGCAQVVVQGE